MDNDNENVTENENQNVTEEYVPKSPNYYNYKGKNNLLLYFSDEITSFHQVHICAYKVNNTGKKPFLSFLLHQQQNTKTLDLPIVPIFKNFEATELVNYSKICLFGLCKFNEYNTFIESLEFNGFYIYDNKLYLFFDITNCEIQLDDTYSNSPIWFGLIDEIVNYKKICSLNINENVANLFLFNEPFCYLVDNNGENYEIPVVSFIGLRKEQVGFKSVFGESSQNKNEILGPYYYFTNFINAFASDNCDSILRFAIFIGNVKYIENDTSDPIDESEIKQERLRDENLDQNMERLLMRISDHDGLWAKSYDSAYLGNIELDNGEYLKNVPTLVIKEYEQQVVLSYHYKNKNTINGPENEYAIL